MKPDTTRIKQAWERVAPFIVFVAVFVAILGWAYGVQETHQIKNQNTVLIAQNKEITSLLKQHSNDFAFTNKLLDELTVAGKVETALAIYLIGSQDAVCKATGAQCPTFKAP